MAGKWVLAAGVCPWASRGVAWATSRPSGWIPRANNPGWEADAAGSLRSGPRNRRGITLAILYCSSSRSQSPDLRGQGSRPHPSIGVRVRTWELLLGVRHCAKHSTRCLISFCQSSDSYCSTVASRKRNNLSRATRLESQSKFVYLQTMSSGPWGRPVGSGTRAVRTWQARLLHLHLI